MSTEDEHHGIRYGLMKMIRVTIPFIFFSVFLLLLAGLVASQLFLTVIPESLKVSTD
jgi:hypothetical protein